MRDFLFCRGEMGMQASTGKCDGQSLNMSSGTRRLGHIGAGLNCYRFSCPALPSVAAGGNQHFKSSFYGLGEAASRATTRLSAMQLTTASNELRMMLFMGAIVNGTVSVL